MIRYVDDSLLPSLKASCGGPFGCRIASAAEAYGIHSRVADFWLQDKCAAFCKIDDVLVLQANENADFEEISAFLSMTGSKRVLCEAEAAREIGLMADVSGEIMTIESSKNETAKNNVILNPNLRELHELLCECKTQTFLPPAFEPFYLDLSHRIRHGTAVTVGIQEQGKLIACAICTAKIDEEAIVSAVAVHPETRRKGYGAAVIQAMLSCLAPRKVFIFHAQQENEAFYASCGFVPCGGFSECVIDGGVIDGTGRQQRAI